MSSSSQKGNIGSFLLTLSVVAFIFIIWLVAQSMITEGVPAGKYNNPNVSTYIVEGSIYDTNGRTFSLEIPKYDCYFDTSKMNSAQLELAIETTAFYSNISSKEIKNRVNSTLKSYFLVASDINEKAVEEFLQTLEGYNLQNAVIIEKKYSRSYPAMFHAAQLIAEVEKNLKSTISPRPGYNSATTYGKNIYLTLDIDVQYIVDLAVQDLNNIVPSENVYAFVMNANNGDILGMSTYPFYDLNDEAVDKDSLVNIALLSSFEGIEPNFISKVTDNMGNTLFTGKEFDISSATFTKDYPSTIESMASANCSVVRAIPALEKPKYYIVVGVINPIGKVNTDYIGDIADYIADGLKSQSKI